ncbi:MAG: zinc ribbon domain-containing protein [Anaerolineaceae bacterium]|jgi:RNA polymerase subunit RPABC4/transcription elongation factor Spt4|nr:zinc ribbon domain-containing protein [Anaerolineaceae bacterium]
MDQRVYHGNINPNDIAEGLIAQFNRGNLRAQQIGKGEQVIVQIATRERPSSGGQTALSITIRVVDDGIIVQIGKQNWLGVAASLGSTALRAIHNPLSLLSRLDDLAQDIEYLQITDEVWDVIEGVARSIGAGKSISDRFRRMVCKYCETANPVGTSSCIACGAPLGSVQPSTCLKCGFVITASDKTCPNCGNNLLTRN